MSCPQNPSKLECTNGRKLEPFLVYFIEVNLDFDSCIIHTDLCFYYDKIFSFYVRMVKRFLNEISFVIFWNEIVLDLARACRFV